MRLSNKFLLWSALNVALLFGIAAAGVAWLLFGSRGLLPSVVFQGGINSAMQVVGANLQYKTVPEWDTVLRTAEQNYGVHFDIYALDSDIPLYRSAPLPDAVLALARRLPRPQALFCEEPVPDEDPIPALTEETGNGFMPAGNSLFVRAGAPVRYWYGRTLFVQIQDYDTRYVLLAASSPSFSGNGLFFNLAFLLMVAGGILVLSYLWWCPFVLHITRPIARITGEAEKIAAGNYVLPETEPQRARPDGLHRHDEIGRLEQAVDSMSDQLIQRMCGQRRFIRHIAHELGSPLARIRFGLAALDPLPDPKKMERLHTLSRNAEELSELVNDLLGYLRSEGLPGHAHLESFALADVVRELVQAEKQEQDIRLDLPTEALIVHTDLECLRRALSNVLRNAVNYAGEAGPISLRVSREGPLVCVRVDDCGAGVPETELPHLTEVFFRGERAMRRRGGSGLGLSIVKHCMDICGGSVTFANRVPHGFSATLRFPQTPPGTRQG